MNLARCCGLAVLIWAADVSLAEAQCSYTLNPTTFTVGGTPSTQTLSVITGTACSWSATTTTGWITITSGAGSGIGSVTFSVAQNATGSPRTGTLMVGGQAVTVDQGTGGCTGSVTPVSFAVDAIATSRTVSVIAGTACSWTATTTASWITVTSASGSGIGSVTFSVAANTTGAARTGTLTIAGQTVTVIQAATGCSAAVTPTSFDVDALATSRTLSVTSGTSCSWTATPTASWITVTSGATGSGIGSVTFSVAANTTGAARTGTLTAAGQTVTVNQSATGCSATLTPNSFDVDAVATSRTLSVTSGTSCSWTATTTTSWIAVTAGASGSGIGAVTFSVAANTTGSARTGTLTVAAKTVTVNQSATGCSAAVTPDSFDVGALATSRTLSVTSGTSCSWTATTTTPWITITAGASGSGIGSVTFSIAANTTATPRSGTLTVAGQPVAVTQAAGSTPPPPTPANLRVIR